MKTEIKKGDFITTATTPIRGFIKLFNLLKDINEEQRVIFLQKMNINDIQLILINNNLKQNRKKHALRLFLETCY